MMLNKLWPKNKDEEIIFVTGGSWAGVHGKGKYEVHMAYRKDKGFVLLYDDVHQDDLKEGSKEKTEHREKILGHDFFSTHTVYEFGRAISELDGSFGLAPKTELYLEFCRMEYELSGKQPEDVHAPFPKREEVQPGETICFGSYFIKDEINKAPVEWLVLRVIGEKALLMSKYGLMTSGYCDMKKVNKDLKHLEWNHSLARYKCNIEFYGDAFNDVEKDCLLPKTVKEAGYGKLCRDKVFLLSEREVRFYMPEDVQRKCEPTLYAKKYGARMGWNGDELYTGWWLLPECEASWGKLMSASGVEYSNGEIYPKAVFHNGEIDYHGRNIYHTDFTIRPCIMLNLSKLE